MPFALRSSLRLKLYSLGPWIRRVILRFEFGYPRACAPTRGIPRLSSATHPQKNVTRIKSMKRKMKMCININAIVGGISTNIARIWINVMENHAVGIESKQKKMDRNANGDPCGKTCFGPVNSGSRGATFHREGRFLA